MSLSPLNRYVHDFVHLRVHSEFSIINGLIRIPELVKTTAQCGMSAVALTEHMNVFSAIKFYQAALAQGIKPLFGADLCLENTEQPEQPFLLTALCQNEQGLHHLRLLLTRAYQERSATYPVSLKEAWLFEWSEGLILLSGAEQGEIGKAILSGQTQQASTCLERWLTGFPNRFYLALQRTGQAEQARYIDQVLVLADAFQTPYVATNAVCFLEQTDAEAHEAKVCIHQSERLADANRSRLTSAEQYFKSIDSMAVLFADLPSALINTVEIAKRCTVPLQLDKVCLPDYPMVEKHEGNEGNDGASPTSTLAAWSQTGLKQRFPDQMPAPSWAVYQDRLAHELSVISRMGFASYFLIVADFIRWAKSNQIPVGPGRGSGAGSLVAYALGITDLDPLPYGLLFERFLNPERVTMPDFDIDFCMDKRDRVIDYVMQRYGRDRVAQIITYGTMAAKAVIRDVGRVLDQPYGFVDSLAKLIPFEIGITLEKALAQEPILKQRYQSEEDVRLLFDLAKKLEGMTRNVGKHAGGVVIAPGRLTAFTALYREAGDDQGMVTQFDKDDIESVGLIKFDFLGLKTLTVIQHALDLIQAQTNLKLDFHQMGLTDSETFQLLQRCQTTAIFQLESRGMRDLVKNLQPDCFEDLIALLALFRPGPLQSGMVDDFIQRKHGHAVVVYLHPSLEPILRPTYGVILYQEQVMQIAQVLAGYTLGQADLLRRAMGKKKPEEMAKQRDIFVTAALKQGIGPEQSKPIFDLMEKFSGYGFNKSHSAAYALLVYQTAFLKTHYPIFFMTAVLSCDMDHSDKIALYAEACRDLGIKLHPPHVNQSVYRFTPCSDGIRFGLGAIKGLGEGMINRLIEVRTQEGEFTHLFDFCQKIQGSKLNKRALESLIKAGALDNLGADKATLWASYPKALQYAEQADRFSKQGQLSLFESCQDNEWQYETAEPWADERCLADEKSVLGIYLSSHPLDKYQSEMLYLVTHLMADLAVGQSVSALGLLVDIRKLRSKTGKSMAVLTLADKTGKVGLTLFPEAYQRYQAILEVNKVLLARGLVEHDSFTGSLRIKLDTLLTLEQARSCRVQGLCLKQPIDALTEVWIQQFERLIQADLGGACPILLECTDQDGLVQLELGVGYRIHPSDLVFDALAHWLGKTSVSWVYGD